MAKIGLNNFRYFELTESDDGGAIYGAAKKPGKAVSCSVEVTASDAKLYADDAVAESDSGFSSGTVTMTLDENDIPTQAALLGHTVEDGLMIRSTSDTAPYVGLGRIVTKMVGGVKKYEVEFLNKVQFSEPSQDNDTRGEDLEFGTPEIEGTVMTLDNGNWSWAKSFSSKQDALNYLISVGSHYTITYDKNTGTGNPPAAAVVAEGDSITVLPGQGAMIAPSGKTFGGWVTTAAGTTAITEPYTPTGDATLYALWETSGT